jgi:Flp pilus assembly protein TadG
MLLKRDEGAAAVEFALILLPLLILLFGIIEFGMILYFQGVVSAASREGARHGIIVSRPSDIKKWLEDEYCPGLIPGCVATPTYGTGNSGDPLTVKVEYDYTYTVIANLIPGLATDGKITLTGTTTMYYE